MIGAFYLTDKEGADEFSESDQELIELLAAHAAIAVTNARLYERTRELSILDERNRLALELHDVISQKLFALSLTAESAGQLLDVDLEAAREQIDAASQLSQEALEELRYLILELRPPELERDGLATTLRKHVEVLRRVQSGRPRSRSSSTACRRPTSSATASCCASRRRRCRTRSSTRARRGSCCGSARPTAGVVLEVTDDGGGFDPQASGVRSRRLGLSSMEERARRLGGKLRSPRSRARARPCASRRRLSERSASSSSTTTRSCAKGSARSCASRRASTSSARRATASRRSRGGPAAPGRRADGSRDAEARRRRRDAADPRGRRRRA